MALNFNGATAQVDFGSGSTIDDLATLTIMFVFKATTLDSTFRYLLRKFTVGVGGINVNSHDSILEFTRAYTAQTTNLTAVSSTTISTGTWYIAFFVDGGAAVAPHIYYAAIGNALAEVSYTTQTSPLGTLDTDAAASALVGFRDATRRWVGDISTFAMWAEAMTIGQCREAYYSFYPSANLKVFSHLGYAGTGTQPDWSGHFNTGAVTAATVSPHAPLQVWGGALSYSPYVVAAAGGDPEGLLIGGKLLRRGLLGGVLVAA